MARLWGRCLRRFPSANETWPTSPSSSTAAGLGVWRIMNILDEFNVKATFYCCALALERNPDVAREITARGHEVFGHGNRWEEYFRMSRDEEREAIRSAVESIERTTGQRPLGWYCRYGPSVNTRELVVEEGGFIYDCNSYNDDLPYYTNVNGKKWLVIPYSLEVNDTKFWRGGMTMPEHFYEVARGTFDLLLQRGGDPPQDDVRGAALPHHRQAVPRGGAEAVSGVRDVQAQRVVRPPDRHSPALVAELPVTV